MKIKKLLSLVLPFMLILSVIPTGLFSITASGNKRNNRRLHLDA